MIFEQIYRQILRAYVNIWSKNLRIKMPKMAILTAKWSFERSRMMMDIPHNAIVALLTIFKSEDVI